MKIKGIQTYKGYSATTDMVNTKLIKNTKMYCSGATCGRKE